MKDNMKILVVTDVQRDFFSPDGSLYVKGGEKLPEKIVGAASYYDAVIFTLDWHPFNHCSFKEQGGPWPSHCVQYTQGAGLPDCFSAIMASKPFCFYFKGSEKDQEQYGAFEHLQSRTIRQWFDDSAEIGICGIAGDYCVKETTARLLRHVPAGKVRMLTGLIASIDGGAALDSFIEENNLQVKTTF